MVYTKDVIHGIVEKQNNFFRSGKTLDVNFRRRMLIKLKNAVMKYKDVLVQALSSDLGRSDVEAYMCDIGTLVLELNETLRGLRRWAKPEIHFSGLLCFPGLFTKVYKMPYGTVLIISPFNFPVLLSLGVLVAAISGGNTAVVKVSSKSVNCSKAVADLISETFTPDYVTVIQGGHDVADMCLAQRFDKIFYTGSPEIAKHIMTEAAKNLTPVALELGGETGNWCIIRKDANLKDAARKVAFFKLCNSGQICININQVAVAEEVADEFVGLLKSEFEKQIGKNAVENPEYPKLISAQAYDKCKKEAELYRDRIVYGGFGSEEKCKYAPSIIYPVNIDEPIVNHELFNPLLPVVTFRDCDVESLLDTVSRREKPLALYVFSKNRRWADRVMRSMQYGGGCINEVCYHMMVRGVPFNGVGHSGIGAYHGKWGFAEFTHPSTVLRGSSHLNLPLRYHPYGNSGIKFKLIKFFEK
ncbi:MAG: aldehyde dehydrogenase family protein [Sphaerochaetaceae bacterium]|nr:aldehyde dehydrogenase family protein [Sphaerochaetaceae bacterium]